MQEQILLTEDNAGTLMIGCPVLGWWDVTSLQDSANFSADAQAVIDGNTADWTAEYHPHNREWWFRQDVNPVASYDRDSRQVKHALVERLGFAAKAYLGIKREDYGNSPR